MADASVDVIISNCVVNLSTNKQAVFDEAFRVLRPGGRLSISDLVNLADLPDRFTTEDFYVSCVANTEPAETIERLVATAGFVDAAVVIQDESADLVTEYSPDSGLENYVASASITAIKPLTSEGSV